ncbi:hypothetical protein N7512_006251 [Penicillium capsulatum]|nr:hypothetical protein N7512_006251 [Penicillium capsulatum]
MGLENWGPHDATKFLAFTANVYRDLYPAIDPARPELRQEGKIVVITGASRGLGQLGFAASFAVAGASAIVLTGRSVDGLKETEQLITKTNPAVRVLCIPLDVTDEHAVNTAFEEIHTKLGTPHVLINNAGILAPPNTITGSNLDTWWAVHEVNIKGPFLVTRAFLHLTGPHPERPTTIINLTSSSSMGTPPGLSPYSMSKTTMYKFTGFLSAEYPDITSVTYDPGVVATDMSRSVGYLKTVSRDTPELSGGAAVWLASGDKKYLSGRVFFANWDVDEVERRKDEIVEQNLLTLWMKGVVGGPDVVVKSFGRDPE